MNNREDISISQTLALTTTKTDLASKESGARTAREKDRREAKWAKKEHEECWPWGQYYYLSHWQILPAWWVSCGCCWWCERRHQLTWQINCLELNQIRTHKQAHTQAHTHLPCDVRNHDWYYYNHCAIIGAFKIQLSLNATKTAWVKLQNCH